MRVVFRGLICVVMSIGLLGCNTRVKTEAYSELIPERIDVTAFGGKLMIGGDNLEATALRMVIDGPNGVLAFTGTDKNRVELVRKWADNSESRVEGSGMTIRLSNGSYSTAGGAIEVLPEHIELAPANEKVMVRSKDFEAIAPKVLIFRKKARLELVAVGGDLVQLTRKVKAKEPSTGKREAKSVHVDLRDGSIRD